MASIQTAKVQQGAINYPTATILLLLAHSGAFFLVADQSGNSARSGSGPKLKRRNWGSEILGGAGELRVWKGICLSREDRPPGRGFLPNMEALPASGEEGLPEGESHGVRVQRSMVELF